MPGGAQRAQQRQQRPGGGRELLPAPRQRRAGQQRAGQAGVEMGGRRILGARQPAGDDLEQRIRHHQPQRQQRRPAQILRLALRADDDQRAGHAAGQQQPAPGRDALAQRQRRQQRDQQWREHDDGGELAHRHHLQAEEGQHAQRQQAQPAQQLQARPLGAQQCAAAARQHRHRGHPDLEQIARPDHHPDRRQRAGDLDAGVEAGEQRHRGNDKQDALKRAGVGRRHRRATHARIGVRRRGGGERRWARFHAL